MKEAEFNGFENMAWECLGDRAMERDKYQKLDELEIECRAYSHTELDPRSGTKGIMATLKVMYGGESPNVVVAKDIIEEVARGTIVACIEKCKPLEIEELVTACRVSSNGIAGDMLEEVLEGYVLDDIGEMMAVIRECEFCPENDHAWAGLPAKTATHVHLFMVMYGEVKERIKTILKAKIKE